jgi:hypothetical protein
MTADDERWLRDRMAAVAAVEPPADLAARAERTAGRIRRRRYGLAAGVAAVAAAVPLVLGGAGGTDRSLPPARPADPACQPSEQVLPDQPDAVSAADVTWPYRGDPALRPTLDRVMTGSIDSLPGEPALATRPLYARRLAEPAGSAVFVFAAEFASRTQWMVLAAALPADPRGDLPLRFDGPVSSARLPRLGPEVQVSLLVPVEGAAGGPLPATGWDRYGNLLVALGAPGADQVEYRACYRDRFFSVRGSGDVLVRPVGPVDAPGQLRVSAGSRLLAGGEVGEPLFGRPAVVLPAVEPVPVPAGTREVQRLRAQGGGPQGPQSLGATVPAATVIARCRGAAPLEVSVDYRPLGRVPCDEQVHVLAEKVSLLQGQPLAARGVPELRGDPDEPVSYDVVVITAG